MDYFELLLLGLLVLCGVCTCITKNLLSSAVIFMAYSVIMSVLWALLRAPDLAVTEAAVGAGDGRAADVAGALEHAEVVVEAKVSALFLEV